MSQKSTEKTSRHIQILHLSDLHFGMSGQKILWPTVRSAFYDDIRKMHRKCGDWQLVLFSGDLTQMGSKKEFEDLTEALQNLWSIFRELGFYPNLFVIPGNHDLQRPTKLDPAATVLQQWHQREDLRKLFWENNKNAYRELIDSAFLNYVEWKNSLSQNEIPILTATKGLLPGDNSSILEINDMRLGLVGINSTWLQLGDGDYNGYLHIDPSQLMALTNNDPDAWSEKNDFNLIVTHHPSNWLHEGSKSSWLSEIDTRSRFDAHVFGHMHELSVETQTKGGAKEKRSFQAASLFGLEKYGTDAMTRRHGYSLLRFNRSNEKSIRIWPRRAHRLADGAWKLIPDFDFYLDDDEESVSYSISKSHTPQPTTPTKQSTLAQIGDSPTSLSSIKKDYPLNAAFIEIRKVDQAIALSELNSDRPIWIVSDWGLGTIDFIRCLQEKLPRGTKLFQLDIHDCKTRDEIFSKAEEQLGFSFQQLGQYLDAEGHAIFVFDEAFVGQHPNDSLATQLEIDLQQIITTLISFAKSIKIIVTSKFEPLNPQIRVIKLKALDELDTSTYIAAHPRGGREAATSNFVTTLYRHTDGIPARLDSALQHVQLAGLSELSSINTDISGKQAGEHKPPPGLAEAIAELEDSHDPSVARALQLLKALTMFPSGERFNTIKRFNGADGFYIQNAQLLINHALVDTTELNSVGELSSRAIAPALVVRRPVREYLYANLPASELRILNKKAMALYFGKNWQTEEIKPPPSLRFDQPGQGAWVLNNASLMVMRTVREAAEATEEHRLNEVLNLATSFCASLGEGDHFRAAYLFCEDAIPLLEEASKRGSKKLDLTLLKLQWSKSARMLRETKKAKQILIEMASSLTQKSFKQSALLTLALCHEGLGEREDAIAAAKECIKLNPKSNLALQAHGIILHNDKNVEDKEEKLKQLEILARKKKAFVVANNIALSRAERLNNFDDAKKIALIVSGSAEQGGDHYNALRAHILIAKGTLKENKRIDSISLTKLIGAYHYLYSQRFDGLFDDCHAVLWSAFEASGETGNLLRLFRHSSFMWRLRGDVHKEDAYLVKLKARCSTAIEAGFRNVDVAMAYFLTRTLQAVVVQKLDPQPSRSS